MKRSFGRDYVADDRDWRIKKHRTARRSRHWKLGPVTDQGDQSSCVGHAWLGWFSSSPVRQQPISASGIYELAKIYDEWEGTDYDGTSVRGAAKLLQVTGHVLEYRFAWSLEQLLPHLLNDGPLVLGVNWYAGMQKPDTAGYIHVRGRSLGGHALLLYGADVTKERASLRNSWGGRWGLGGNCYLSFEDLARLLSEDGECCAATEVKANRR